MFNRENKIVKHKCHSWCWSCSTTALLPSLSTLQGQVHTREGVRKWVQTYKWPFFPAHHSLTESWTGTSKLPTEPLALDLWIYVQLSGFSCKAVPGPHGQSFSLLCLQALLRNMLLSLYLHPTTQCFTVIQLLVCWDSACCTDSTVSAVCCSLIHICIFLSFLSYPQCVSCLQQEPSMQVSATSIISGSLITKYLKLAITGIAILGQQCLNSQGVNKHMILCSVILNFNKALVWPIVLFR